MDKLLTFNAEGPGFKSRLGQGTSFKNYKILFLIEDTSELECWHLYLVHMYLDSKEAKWKGEWKEETENFPLRLSIRLIRD